MASGASESTLSIRDLDTLDEIFAAHRILVEIWGGRDPLPAPLMRALQYSGNYVAGLYDGDRIVGASVAFFSPPEQHAMHSHVTGVLPEYQRRGFGRLLKQQQRQWAIARDIGTVTWTFDPLVRRNAHFNAKTIGVRFVQYLVDQYGSAYDGAELDQRGQGVDSDRLLVAWALASAPVREPDAADVVATVQIPDDIEALRRTDPTEAAAWRLRVRDEMLGHYSRGLVIGGFDDERGYLFVQG